jgi:putative membrane protein
VSDEQSRTSGARRWPRWVYETGSEPDARFSFANERTFLAWIRTALALLAAGVALDAVPLPIPGPLRTLIAAVFVLLGLTCAVASWVRWARAERAMRRGEPLPSVGFGAVLAAFVLVVGLGLLVAGLS